LRRSLGRSQQLRFDPFLMLDEFFSDDPDDYLAGFPSHPHRGFETVTYMLDGHMRHEDSFGNRGDLGPGDVQWMTAAHGIIHSEMPQQTEGRMRGFQLWINLPAREKMKPAAYRDIPAAEIPRFALAGGGEVRVIAGSLQQGGVTTAGPIRDVTTSPVYLDVHLPSRSTVNLPLPATHNAFVYVYDGAAESVRTASLCRIVRRACSRPETSCVWPQVPMARERWCSRAHRSGSPWCSTVRSS
jgi:redox-sensitive bicupin YhaK (pirin superfamily)